MSAGSPQYQAFNVTPFHLIDKLTRDVTKKDHRELSIERGSVYGAAILMPQIARSSNWNRECTSLMLSAYFYLFLCIFLHGSLLTYLAKEERVMDAFAGQMYLCDFGARAGDACENSESSCMGPGGTKITPARLYSWKLWTLRTFVRDALKGVFPDKADDIERIADPGEYGLESYYCRLLCVIIFITSILSEIWLCIDMGRLLMFTPNADGKWFDLLDESEDVQVKVNGMPVVWKAINFVLVLCPKCCLVYITASWGVDFLMETGGIDSMIVNSVALSFLLTVDDLITTNLMSKGTQNLLEMCEGMPFASDDDKDLKNEIEDAETTKAGCCYVWMIFKNLLGAQFFKFIVVLLLTAAFVAQYYLIHCKMWGGQYVSKGLHLPTGLDFSFLNADPTDHVNIGEEESRIWKMPK